MTASVTEATEIYYFVLGVLTLVGAVVGYWSDKRIPALIWGLIGGVILIVAGCLVYFGGTQAQYQTPGLILGLLATAGLAGQFIPKVMINRAPPHVIAMAILSGIGLILTLIAFARK